MLNPLTNKNNGTMHGPLSGRRAANDQPGNEDEQQYTDALRQDSISIHQ
jgi:hypothetical protein